jgi:predicted nuclease of restriction endonuclease-like RecB superfamily
LQKVLDNDGRIQPLAFHRRDPTRRVLLEIAGFWTPDYLAKKLERLRAAGVTNLILCIDEARRCSEVDIPRHALVVRFRKKVDASKLLDIIECGANRPDEQVG